MKYTLDYEKYAELARRVAAEGSVLLRNEDGCRERNMTICICSTESDDTVPMKQ